MISLIVDEANGSIGWQITIIPAFFAAIGRSWGTMEMTTRSKDAVEEVNLRQQKALTMRVFALTQIWSRCSGLTALGGLTGCREGEIGGSATGQTAQGGQAGATTADLRKALTQRVQGFCNQRNHG
ncbi:hypothetical protein [Hymenobacter antarcticus]|uniref:Uncharacterized protein n=1 Tax=Hymenobacter antarcticus TaxID=486270 RepID=A0ABP7QUB9_9BACT